MRICANQLLCFITLPEDEVFRLCVAGRDRGMVADLWPEGLSVRYGIA